MDEEKTESPSSRKISKAREEGDVAKSVELSGFVGLIVGLSMIFLLFAFWIDQFSALYREAMSLIGRDLDVALSINIFFSVLLRIAIIISPLFLAVIIAGVIGNVGQIGLLFSPKAITPKLSKISIIKGLKNLFSPKKIVDGLLVTSKVLLAFFIGFFVFFLFLKEIPSVGMFDIFSQMIWLKQKALILVGVLLLLFFVLSIFDFILKKRRYIKSLRMSKQEVKEENKNIEGNPEIKAKIRQTMMKMSLSKMMKAIPTASVVVTNPTHYAVALRFDRSMGDVGPKVVAKGIDELAIRIKAVARENDILVLENPSLARELYAKVDVDELIDESLWGVVAELFREVIRIEELQGKKSRFQE